MAANHFCRRLDLVLYQTQSELAASGYRVFRVTNDADDIELQRRLLSCIAGLLGLA